MRNLWMLPFTFALLMTTTTANAATTNNQGESFEQGQYQENAEKPYGFNWNQNSLFESTNNDTVNWHIDLKYDEEGNKSNKMFRGTPAIDKNGVIYMNNMGGYLYAINKDGSTKWEIQSAAYSSPIIAKDGTIINADGQLRAINPEDGTVKWTAKTDRTTKITNAVIDSDGLIYAWNTYSSDSYLYVYNPDGTLNHKGAIDLSKFGYQTTYTKSMLLGENGLIYIYTNKDSYHYLIALNKKGEMVWNMPFGYTSGGFTLDSNGDVILTGGGTNTKQDIYRLNGDTGVIVSQKTLLDRASAAMSDPVVDYSTEDIYLGMNGNTYKLDKDFNVLWNKDYGNSTAAVIDKSHNVLFTTIHGIFKLTPDGEEVWSLLPTEVPSVGAFGIGDYNPAIGADGKVYVAYQSTRYGETYGHFDFVSIGDPVIQWDDTCVNIDAVEKKIEDGTLSASEKEQELAHFKGIVDKLENYTPSN